MSDESIFTGGLKFDALKPRYELIPPTVILELVLRDVFKVLGSHALREVAIVYAAGALKYEDRNWERGMDWTRLLGAAHRHLQAVIFGEQMDTSTGSNHLACVAFNLIGLITYSADPDQFEKYDDRTEILRLHDTQVWRWGILFTSLNEVASIEEIYLMLLHWTGRQSPINPNQDADQVLYPMLERVLAQLEVEAANSHDGGDFIPDGQKARDGDLKADLDSRDLPVPIMAMPSTEESPVMKSASSYDRIRVGVS